jgi:hypothetical protein
MSKKRILIVEDEALTVLALQTRARGARLRNRR